MGSVNGYEASAMLCSHAESCFFLRRALSFFFSLSFLYPTSSWAVLRREGGGTEEAFFVYRIRSWMIEDVDFVCVCEILQSIGSLFIIYRPI